MPHPGSFVTPQDKGNWGAPTRAEIHKFFDPTTYRGLISPPRPKPLVHMERHTTKENILKFFDPTTYRAGVGHEGVCSTSHAQKRPSSSPMPHPAAKARMGKSKLLEKFQLAAQLNGVSWDDMVVSRLWLLDWQWVMKPMITSYMCLVMKSRITSYTTITL